MRIRTVMLATLVLSSTVLAQAPASALPYDPYPWCAVYGDSDGPGTMSCYYATRELCMQTLSGIGGVCVQSPYYGHGPRTERQSRRDKSKD